ncbi:MAG: hypothetical protein Q8N08_01820 [Methanobacteriaceae archaeon]|nr:hypothetical protein [Methanobacteriaceae archaeon]
MEETKKSGQKSEYVAAIIFNLIWWYIVNNLLNWQVYFVTNAFNEVLWIINLSIIVSIIGNGLLLFYSPERLRHGVKIFINIISFIAVYIVWTVFPFNFNNSFYDWGFGVLLILAMIGIIIAIIVEIYLLVTGKPKLTGN